MSDEFVTVSVVECRKGARLDFQIEIDGGVDSAYTQTSFKVAREWNDTDLLIDLDSTVVVPDFTNPDMTVVSIGIGATAITEDIPREGISAVALLRMGDPSDVDGVFAMSIPFMIRPTL